MVDCAANGDLQRLGAMAFALYMVNDDFTCTLLQLSAQPVYGARSAFEVESMALEWSLNNLGGLGIVR